MMKLMCLDHSKSKVNSNLICREQFVLMIDEPVEPLQIFNSLIPLNGMNKTADSLLLAIGKNPVETSERGIETKFEVFVPNNKVFVEPISSVKIE
jgi:hypothetical protein